MKCEICGKGPMDPEMVGLTRVNEKGVKGIWRCKAHLTFEQEAAIDPEIKEITDMIESENRRKRNGY